MHGTHRRTLLPGLLLLFAGSVLANEPPATDLPEFHSRDYRVSFHLDYGRFMFADEHFDRQFGSPQASAFNAGVDFRLSDGVDLAVQTSLVRMESDTPGFLVIANNPVTIPGAMFQQLMISVGPRIALAATQHSYAYVGAGGDVAVASRTYDDALFNLPIPATAHEGAIGAYVELGFKLMPYPFLELRAGSAYHYLPTDDLFDEPVNAGGFLLTLGAGLRVI